MTFIPMANGEARYVWIYLKAVIYSAGVQLYYYGLATAT